MIEWIALLPAILLALVLLLVPGMGVAWLAGFRGYVLIGASAGASMGVVGIASLFAPLIGLRWSLLPVVVVALAATAVVAAIAVFVRRRREPALLLAGGPIARWVWLAAGAATLAWAVILVLGMGAPDHPAERFDAIFHINAIEFVLESGSASPFDMTMVTPDRDSSFYPTLWHAYVSLIVPVAGGAVPATNAFTVAAIAGIWPAAVGMLTAVLFPAVRLAAILAPAATLGFALYPLGFLNWGVLYPNLLGNLLIPVLLGLAALILRPWTRRQLTMASLVGVAALTAAGAAFAHPSSLLAALALSVPLCVAVIIRVWRRRRAKMSTRVIVTAVLSGAIAALAVAWSRLGVSGGDWDPYLSFAQALGEAIFLGPAGRPPALLVFALAVVGAREAWRTRASWIIATQAVAVAFFLVVAWLRLPPVRALVVGVWYDDATRVGAVLVFAALPLAALGACVVLRALPRLWRGRSRGSAAWRVAGAVLALGALAIPQLQLLRSEVSFMRNVSFAFSDRSEGLSPDEAAMFEKVASLIPPGSDAVVAGNPLTAAGLLYAYEGIPVLFPHIKGDFGPDAALIGRELSSGTREVCAAIERENVEYVLDFGDVSLFPEKYDDLYSGFDRLSRSAILTRVASIGDTALYHVTGCG